MSIAEVTRFAQQAHGEQKYGELPYIVHLMLVASNFSLEPYITVAILHDVAEDTSVTVDDLRGQFGSVVADAVDCLTRRADEPYLESYIGRVAANDIAKVVKIADLEENIHSATLWFPEFGRLVPRYRRALALLRGDIADSDAVKE